MLLGPRVASIPGYPIQAPLYQPEANGRSTGTLRRVVLSVFGSTASLQTISMANIRFKNLHIFMLIPI